MVSEVHFVHTSDWHLGFRQYNLPERFDDFYHAADEAVNKIITIKPQFVLHTGDLFHHQKPDAGAIRQAVRLFKKLKKATIPVLMIRGNHDAKISKYLRSDGNIISLLDDLELVKNVTDKIHFQDDNIRIYGVGYYTGSSAVGILEDLLSDDPPQENIFDIIAMHAFVEGQIEVNQQISMRDLKDKEVNYIGMGHYHLPWKKQKQNLYAPGSTETTSTKDWVPDKSDPEFSLHSQIFEIKSTLNGSSWGPTNVISHSIVIRPKLNLILESKKKNIDELILEIQLLLENKIVSLKKITSWNPLVKMLIVSDLSMEELNTIDFEKIKDRYELLHFIHDLHGKNFIDQMSFESFQNHQADEIIAEMLGNDPDSENYLSLIIDLIQKFGRMPLKQPTNELIEQVISAVLGEEPDEVILSPQETNEVKDIVVMELQTPEEE